MESRPSVNASAGLSGGRAALGLSVTLPAPSVIELAAKAGYDFVRIDLEHAYLSVEETRALLDTARLLRMPCQVRTPDLVNVTALLSREPSAIMIPHVESAEDARRAVDMLRFAPEGRRGMDGNTRLMRCGGMKRSEYMAYQQENLKLIIQIESRPALERIHEILSVPGVDMVATGRADLSQELGVPGQKEHPDVIAAEEEIIRKALEHGKMPTIAVDSRERMQALYDMGVRSFLIGKDEALLDKAVSGRIGRFREE